MSKTFSSPKSSKTVVLYEDFSKFRLIGFLKWHWKKIVLFFKPVKELLIAFGIIAIVYILTVIAMGICDVL